MKRWMCLILCLLLPVMAAAENADYRGDGQHMLLLLHETACLREPGGEELAVLTAQSRVIATGAAETSGGKIWHEVYLPGRGYGFVPGACVLPEESRLITYHPGFGVSVGLFTVEDPEQVRVEITSPDGLEYPVVELMWISSQAQEGGTLLTAHFSTAADVCKTTRERICATLYDLNGNPLDLMMMEFDVPGWYRSR